LLGGGGSYVLAGQILALVGGLGTVLGAGVLGRALATPWAGGLAAIGTALLAVVVDGTWWVNPYPLVGALTALALAAGAWCARWPGWTPAVLAGLLGGLCLAMDPRGLPVAVALPLLAVLAPQRWPRRALLAAVVLAGLGSGWALDRGLQAQHGLALKPMETQLRLQHSEGRGPTMSKAAFARAEAEACADTMSQDLSIGALLGDCAQARRSLSTRTLGRSGHLPPVLPGLGLLALGLLPLAWGRRRGVVVGLVFLPSLGALLLGMSWVPYVDRYLLPSAALLGCLGPVGLVASGALIARRWPRLWALGPTVAALWVLLVFPGWHPGDVLEPVDHIRRRSAELPEPLDPRAQLADWAVRTVGPDDLLIDCAELHLRILALPRDLPLWDAPPHDRLCRERIKSPPPVDGALYLVTVHQRGREPDPRLMAPEDVRARGWTELPLELVLDPDSHAARRASWLKRWRYER